MEAYWFSDFSDYNSISYVPREFNNNRQIKGVYLFVKDTLRPKTATWEEIAKDFCKEIGIELSGKGSTRAACKIVQAHWGEFVRWSVKYRS